MERISDTLLDWYAREGRDLPWRRTRDPYRIWLSEVILQQTRVAQGTAYYLRFTERFPDVGSLAAASEDEVLKLWQGLGYYSRARNLHAAARMIVERFSGAFPATPEEVRSLPGVGDYTAAAVCSAACGAPCAVVDGNVYRVLSRLFGLDLPIDAAPGRRAFAELAQELLDERDPGRYNQAIMDFGALVCTPAQPRCGTCPLAGRCLALGAGSVAERPVKRSVAKVRDRWFAYLHLQSQGRLVLHRRGAGDIWQGLYEFPLIETSGPAGFETICAGEEFRSWVGPRWSLTGSVALPDHRLSHQLLHAAVYRLEVPEFTERAAACAVEETAAGERAVPKLLERYLEAQCVTARSDTRCRRRRSPGKSHPRDGR